MNKSLKLEKVSFGYQKDKDVLENISLSISHGSFLGITGNNGSGKSTLTYLLNGLIPHFIKGYLLGEIRVDGISTKSQNVAFFARKVGMIFQNPDFSLFNLTVEEELEFGINNLKLSDKEERIRKALSIVDMQDFIDRDPQTLSFGQKQKVCLAAVLALNTDYIVLDEPTAMLDYKSSLELYKILKKLNIEGKTIIVVEHDTDFLKQFADKIAILHEGKLVASGKTEDILSDKRLLSDLGIKIP